MTTEVLFSNNGYSTLAVGISSTATTLTLTASTGARLPALAAGQVFRGTIFDANGNREIVLVSDRAGDVLTIERSQEGTVARAWLAGDGFELRLTAAGLAAFPQVDKDNNFTADNKFMGRTLQQTAPNYAGLSTGAAETYGVTFTPALNAPAAGMEVRFQAHQANGTTAPTFSVNGSAAEALVKQGGQPLRVGDIAGGAEYTVRKRAVGWEVVSPLGIEAGKPLAKDHGTKSAAYTLQLDEADFHVIAFSAAATLTIASAHPNDRATVAIKNNGFVVTVAGIDNNPPTLTAASGTQDILAIVKSFGKVSVVGFEYRYLTA